MSMKSLVSNWNNVTGDEWTRSMPPLAFANVGGPKSDKSGWGPDSDFAPGFVRKSYSLDPGPPIVMASGTGSGTNDFVYQGGLALNGPKVYNVFVGDWTSDADKARIPRFNQFMTDLLASKWMTIFKQYGCVNPSTFGGSFTIPTPNTNPAAEAKENNSVIETIIQNAISAKVLPEPTDQNTIFVLYLDNSTGISDNNLGITMCAPAGNNSFGYHYHMNTNKGNDCFYSVIPSLNDACLVNSGCTDAKPCSLKSNQTQEQRQTQVISHEIAETITNPQGNGGWYNPSTGAEAGDLCNGDPVELTVGPNTWLVQDIYSKVDGNKCVSAAGAGTSTVPLADIQAGALDLLKNKYNLAGGGIVLTAAILYAVVNKRSAGELLALMVIGFSGGLVATELFKRYAPAAQKDQLKHLLGLT